MKFDNTIPTPALITASTAHSIRAKFFGGEDEIIQTKEQQEAYYEWLENTLSEALRTPDKMSDMEQEFRGQMMEAIDWKPVDCFPDEEEDFAKIRGQFGKFSFNCWDDFYQCWSGGSVCDFDGNADSLEDAKARCVAYLLENYFPFCKLGRGKDKED